MSDTDVRISKDNCQLFIPIENAGVVFRPRGNTTSQLEAVESSEVFCFGSIRATSPLSCDPQVDSGQGLRPDPLYPHIAEGPATCSTRKRGRLMEDVNRNTLEVFDEPLVLPPKT